MSKKMSRVVNDHTFVRRGLIDGAHPQRSRAIETTVIAARAHVEVAIVDATGNEVAIVRVEHWNGEIVAHLWNADTVRADGEPQTIHLIDAARVNPKTKGKRK